jgi:hypothetical protein
MAVKAENRIMWQSPAKDDRLPPSADFANVASLKLFASIERIAREHVLSLSRRQFSRLAAGALAAPAIARHAGQTPIRAGRCVCSAVSRLPAATTSLLA